MEQNRKPVNKPTIVWLINLRQRRRKNTQWRKKQSLQEMVLEKLDNCMKNNETGPLSYTITQK